MAKIGESYKFEDDKLIIKNTHDAKYVNLTLKNVKRTTGSMARVRLNTTNGVATAGGISTCPSSKSIDGTVNAMFAATVS